MEFYQLRKYRIELTGGYLDILPNELRNIILIYCEYDRQINMFETMASCIDTMHYLHRRIAETIELHVHTYQIMATIGESNPYTHYGQILFNSDEQSESFNMKAKSSIHFNYFGKLNFFSSYLSCIDSSAVALRSLYINGYYTEPDLEQYLKDKKLIYKLH